MPIRMLRDWTDSYRFDCISAESEVLFTRLIMKADDYGNFFGDARIIQSMCFPLGSMIVVQDGLDELANRGLIMLYSVDCKDYLHISNFGQRMRNGMKRKFPAHAGEQHEDAARCGKMRLERNTNTNRIETEENRKAFDAFWGAYPKKVGKSMAETAWAKADLPDVDIILKSLHKAKQSPDWIKEKGAFIPHPSTWLNQRRWEDFGMDYAALSSKRVLGASTAQETASQIDEQDAIAWLTENYDNVEIAGSFKEWPAHIRREYLNQKQN